MIAGILSIVVTLFILKVIHSVLNVYYVSFKSYIIEFIVVWFLCSMWLGMLFGKLGLGFLIN